MKRFFVILTFLLPAQAVKLEPQLKFALILTRHGVRSPTWNAERLNQYSPAPWPDWGVPPGNLTAHGRTLMKMMGGFYREYFQSKSLFRGPGCSDVSRTYFWADTDQRTIETARALAEGIAPGCKLEVHSTTDGKTDPLFDPIDAGVAKQDPKLGLAAVMGRIGPDANALIGAHRPAFDMLDRILNGNEKAKNSIFAEPVRLTAGETAVTMTGPLALASTFTENLLLEYTNGMRDDQLGWGRLDASNLQQIMSLHTTYAELMRRTPYLARVRGSNLLNFILRSLEQAATGKSIKGAAATPETELVVISGHDTNLSNVSAMLALSWLLPGYQRDDVPPGGAIIFSLWQSAGDKRLSIRAQFVAQTMDQMHDAVALSLDRPPAIASLFMPGCSSTDEGFACDWSTFQRLAQLAIDASAVSRN